MIVIGADEAGTGAWAGSFSVCAVAVFESDQRLLKSIGVADSKSLGDDARRRLIDPISDIVICAHHVFGTVEMLNKHGKAAVWQQAMAVVVERAATHVGNATIVIDGANDPGLASRLAKKGLKPKFLPKADVTVPAVSAASIIAKTLRNEHMIDLHAEYPEYGWSRNYGYGTPEHQRALDKYGKTIYHRPWKNLVNVPLRR